MNFTALASRFFRICCSRWLSTTSWVGASASASDLQRQALLPRHRFEGLAQSAARLDHHHFIGQFDVAGLDARQVQDVA